MSLSADRRASEASGQAKSRCLFGAAVSVIALVCELGDGGGAFGQDRPRALGEFQRMRAALDTASIEFTYQNYRRGPDVVLYTGRLAGPDVILINWGNQSGVVGEDPGRAGRPHSVLKTPSDTWAHDHDGLFVMMSETGPAAAENAFALRALGASFHFPFDDIGETLQRLTASQAGPCRYSETFDGSYHVVRAETDQGAVTWWIDPAQGWSPVRVSYARDGRILREARVTLRQFDGVWFPDTVTFSRTGLPAEVVRVLSAEFNRPEHPRRFTPADIGVEPGFIVEKYRAQRGEEMLMWDGSKAVPHREFARREAAGGIQRGPTNRATLQSLPPAPPDAPRPPVPSPAPATAARSRAAGASSRPADVPALRNVLSKWEQYTRDFIRKYKLDEHQSGEALWILRSCQRQANAYLQKRGGDIQEAERELARLQAQGTTPPADVLQNVKARLAVLAQPLDAIFEKRLKPALEKLPTREQREAAAERDQAATKPSAPPDRQP